MITVSDKAKEKVARLIHDAHLDDTYRLRASVAGGGCSGLSYKLDFDNEVRPMDQEFEDKGVRVVVDMKSFPLPGRHRARLLRRLERQGLPVQQPQRLARVRLRRKLLRLTTD